MKDFSRRGFRVAGSSVEARLAYTGFLLFAFIGYLTLMLIGLLRVGPGYHNIVAHYRGSEAEEAFPRAFGQMLEETHFHAFIEGVILLVLTHIFIATSVRRSTKSSIILLAFGATLADLASPWLIRYVAPGFAVLQLASWTLMGATALALMGVPLYEMWWKGDRG
jgi:hypothetical protein